jgi:transcriptional regulator with XRE-family HTH domain
VKDQRQPTASERIERTFARRLLELREERGYSQARLSQELAHAGLKLDALAILRIEKNADGGEGARRIRLSEAAIIARALGVRLDEMLRRTEPLEDEFFNLRKELEMATRHREVLRRTLDEADMAVSRASHRLGEVEAALAQTYGTDAPDGGVNSPWNRAELEGEAQVLGSFESYGEHFTLVVTPDKKVVAVSEPEMKTYEATGQWPNSVMTESWTRMTRHIAGVSAEDERPDDGDG